MDFTLFKGLILAAAGFLAGLGNSLVGGGSMVSLPALFLVGLPSATAIGTNRAAIVVLSVSAALGFRREGHFHWREAAGPASAAGLGGIVGAFITVSLPGRILDGVVLAIFYLFTIFLFVDPFRRWDLDHVGRKVNSPAIFYPTVFLLGFYGGFFGVAVSTLTIIFFKTVRGWDTFKSISVTQANLFFLSVTATILFVSRGKVAFPFAAFLAAGMALGGTVGPKIAVRIGERRVNLLLKILVLFLVTRLTLRYLGK